MPTQKQIRRFATDIIDNWDLDSLVEYAIDQQETWLRNMPDSEFIEEWKIFYDEPFVKE